MTSKKIPLFTLLGLSLLFSLSLSSCLKDECEATRTYIQYNPVYKQLDEIRRDIKVESVRDLKHPGKLYFYGDYILINELKEGLHVIDNQNPTTPKSVAFIDIPGNVDMAVKNDRLYADNYMDLLTINIENPAAPLLISRTENVFTSYHEDPSLGYLVDYTPEEVTVDISCSHPNWGRSIFWQEDIAFADASVDNIGGIRLENAANSGGGKNGTGGSMARFSIVDDYLYTVSESSLSVFDIKTPDQPIFDNIVYAGWGIETIFPYGDHLFIGAAHGMYIFDNSDRRAPVQQSLFEHARACDPVYVVGETAYVTLRDGTECEGFANQLDVVDVSDVTQPRLVASHNMDNPHGLSWLDDTLYICEGESGFKSFDATNHRDIGNRLLHHVKNLQAYDVIALPNQTALVIGRDGLYQFDISDPARMKQLSVLPVVGD